MGEERVNLIEMEPMLLGGSSTVLLRAMMLHIHDSLKLWDYNPKV